MQWELLGFKDDPFKTHPITAYTLELYTGNKDKVDMGLSVSDAIRLLMLRIADEHRLPFEVLKCPMLQLRKQCKNLTLVR